MIVFEGACYKHDASPEAFSKRIITRMRLPGKRIPELFTLAMCVAALLAACSLPTGPALVLEKLPRERPVLPLETRDAWRVPAGSGLSINLGEATAGAVCRVGLLDNGEGDAVEAVLCVDDHAVAAFATSGEHAWRDERLTVPRTGASCRLELSARTDFWISHAEVFVPTTESPAVLIFLIDALRQDHLGCYGYPLDTSPNIDAFAKDAVRLSGVTPSTSWTRPSVATLWTSTHPSVHGAEDRPDMLRKDLPSLAAQLEAGGLETHCFMTNRNCIPVWGFGYDFNRFRDADTANWVNSDDADVVDLAIETVRHAAGRPWYAYVHTMGPHEPYNPPEAFKGRFERSLYARRDWAPEHQEALALYDGEIAYTDEQFGRLVAVMKEQGIYDDALIIVMADHGEEFWDHGGTGHGKTLYEEQLRIPFIIKLPGNELAGEVRDGLAELVDVAPTIIDALGLEPDPRFQGVSMMGLLRGEGPAKPMAFASLALEDSLQRAAKTLDYKYLHDIAGKRASWFNLIEDPGEMAPLEAPPENAPPLAQYAVSMAMRGASGLHVLVVHDATARRRVTGTILAASAESFELRYPPALQETELTGGTLEFDLIMPKQNPDALVPPSWEKVAKTDPLQNFWSIEHDALPDSAHLILRIAPGDKVSLTVEVDGQPIPPEQVHVGAQGENLALDGLERRAEDVAADPAAYDAMLLPREFGVYVWYVPPISTLDDHDLPPELREALKNLGY